MATYSSIELYALLREKGKQVDETNKMKANSLIQLVQNLDELSEENVVTLIKQVFQV